jgi:hypothetical protein
VTIDIYTTPTRRSNYTGTARRSHPDVDGTLQVRMNEAYAVARHKVLSQMKNAD